MKRRPTSAISKRCQRMAVWVLLCLLPALARAVELQPPPAVEAGQAFSVPVQGSGQATFYLVGPDHVVKRTVKLGSDLQIQSSDVRAAGRYQCNPMRLGMHVCRVRGKGCATRAPEFLSPSFPSSRLTLRIRLMPLRLYLTSTSIWYLAPRPWISDHSGQRGRLLAASFHSARCGMDAHGLDAA